MTYETYWAIKGPDGKYVKVPKGTPGAEHFKRQGNVSIRNNLDWSVPQGVIWGSLRSDYVAVPPAASSPPTSNVVPFRRRT